MTSQERRTLLLLLRHAKSAWPDVPDHERPLARRGQQDAPLMGRWLRAAGYIPDRVVCSTARRAAQTWQLAQPALGSAPPAVFDDRLYDAETAQLLDVIRRAPAPVRTLLVVGHDPALPGLARTLAEAPAAGAGTGKQAAAADRTRAKFPHRRRRGVRVPQRVGPTRPGGGAAGLLRHSPPTAGSGRPGRRGHAPQGMSSRLHSASRRGAG
jgi:phosphohistidine phosphatase